MAEQPTISTHVLDAEHGSPLAGVVVTLARLDSGGVVAAGAGRTDDDGRIQRLLDGQLRAGSYRLEFRLGGRFFETVAITFHVGDTSRSYHVPLLLAPYSLTTYRGS
jgi:5-hydroxyisourate hydrolase